MGYLSMMSSLFVAVGILIIVWNAFNVIRWRFKEHIMIGLEGSDGFLRATTAQVNAVEYIPIGLVALVILELSKVNSLSLLIIGGVFLFGRILHTYAILNEANKEDYRLRKLSMMLTFIPLIVMSVALIVQFLGLLT